MRIPAAELGEEGFDFVIRQVLLPGGDDVGFQQRVVRNLDVGRVGDFDRVIFVVGQRAVIQRTEGAMIAILAQFDPHQALYEMPQYRMPLQIRCPIRVGPLALSAECLVESVGLHLDNTLELLGGAEGFLGSGRGFCVIVLARLGKRGDFPAFGIEEPRP